MSRNVLIVGATSSIARAIAGEFARLGDRVVLAARDLDECEKICADVTLRSGAKGGRASAVGVDLERPEEFGGFIERVMREVEGRLDGVVCCQGFMASPAAAVEDPGLARRMVDVNFTSVLLLVNAMAERITSPGGFVGVISSVAGDRGRPSNYVYCSTKSAVDSYLEGLRPELFRRGVSVTTVKPGFVDTAMTWGLPGLFLVASPERAAADVVRALKKGRDVVYTPRFWWVIMTIIRMIPRFVFKRLKL